MELRHLEVFVVVAEELHFARAAERLHLAQSSVSTSIARVEQALGGPVFDRSNRRVALTAAGSAFLTEARHVLDAFERAVQIGRATAAGTAGELGLGYSFSASFVLDALIGAASRHAPELVINPVELYGPLALDALVDGEIDAALIWFCPSTPGITSEVVATRPFVAVVRDDHRLAGVTGIELGQLADDEFVLSPRTQNPGFYDAILDRCRHAGFDPRIRQHVGGFRSVRALIEASGGVGLTVDSTTHDVDLGTTTAIEITDAEPAPLHLARRTDHDQRLTTLRSLLPERPATPESSAAPSATVRD